ncbi:MAG: VWA domain-containing protein [Deltaproteobacteria bacterium]|nr:VWA domain-containing protein [Deltaproteobacteria bacterium]
MNSGGGTNLNAGLVTAYELANANFSENRINRVILMSDGGANVGVTDEELIAESADDSEGEGIYMMGVGVGSTGYFNEALMDTITDAGKGAYVYVDTTAEANKMFGDRFLSNIEVAAKDMRSTCRPSTTTRSPSRHRPPISTPHSVTCSPRAMRCCSKATPSWPTPRRSRRSRPSAAPRRSS